MFKKLLAGAALATSLFAISAPASAALTNWFFDSDGAGGAVAQLVPDNLAVSGAAFVQITYNSLVNPFDPLFTFEEAAFFNAPTIGAFTPINPPAITAKFTGTGSGNISTQKVTFNNDGFLEIFSGASSIAQFNLVQGSGNLQSGTVLPNGTFELIFKSVPGAGMAAGYFFDNLMNDIAPIANSATGLVLGLVTTQANTSPTGTVADPLVQGVFATEFGAAPGGYTSFSNDGFGRPTKLNILNPGQFRMQVPEPSMLGLLGLAFVAAGLTTIRRKTHAA